MLNINFASSLKRNVVISIFALFVLLCTVTLLVGGTYHEPVPPQTLLGVDNKGENTGDRVRFLSSLGYNVNVGAEQTKEITIPMEFNDVYTAYNDFQLNIGTDLFDYRGSACLSCSYPLQGDDEQYSVNLLVYKGRIIGGDICSASLDGEMRSLGKNSDSQKTQDNP